MGLRPSLQKVVTKELSGTMSAIQEQSKKPAYPDLGIYVKDLPEFREYVRRKYDVNLEEDLVVMIEDLIKRQRQKIGMTETCR